MNRGRHGEAPQSTITDVASAASVMPMIAHGPVPTAASVTPVTAPASVATICRICRLRNASSRVSSAFWVELSPASAKLADSTAKRGPTLGCPKKSATSPDQTMPAPVRTAPRPSVVQKVVDRSASVSRSR